MPDKERLQAFALAPVDLSALVAALADFGTNEGQADVGARRETALAQRLEQREQELASASPDRRS